MNMYCYVNIAILSLMVTLTTHTTLYITLETRYMYMYVDEL